MHEDLLGYLLGALDADEQSRIEAKLAESPRLRLELARLRQCLKPLESTWDDWDPPPGLAGRVCESIDAYERSCHPAPRSLSRMRMAAGLCLQRYAVSDCIILTLVVLIAFTLFLPALANSRYQARKVACQENLWTLGKGLFSYSELQLNRFPLVRISGNRSFAGVFAPILLEHELLEPENPPLVCPGSELAAERDGWFLPTLLEIDQATGPRLRILQDRAGGSYAYCVGYLENGRLRAAQNQSRAGFALLSDAPSFHLPDRRSAHHGGRGQNIFYEDGHVTFVTDLRALPGDHPLLNWEGFAEAGVDCSDAVLLPSGSRPVVDVESVRVIDAAGLTSQ
ncbi:MAG: hypothetical protein ACYC3X_08425 [Pirellulaceae bacterium]